MTGGPRSDWRPTSLDDLRTKSKLIKRWNEACYATKSSGRLKPPLRFMYCLKWDGISSCEATNVQLNSPILSLEDHVNFSFGVAANLLSFGRVESTEAHRPHHFDLLGGLSFQVGFWHVNPFRNFGFWWWWQRWTWTVPSLEGSRSA